MVFNLPSIPDVRNAVIHLTRAVRYTALFIDWHRGFSRITEAWKPSIVSKSLGCSETRLDKASTCLYIMSPLKMDCSCSGHMLIPIRKTSTRPLVMVRYSIMQSAIKADWDIRHVSVPMRASISFSARGISVSCSLTNLMATTRCLKAADLYSTLPFSERCDAPRPRTACAKCSYWRKSILVPRAFLSWQLKPRQGQRGSDKFYKYKQGFLRAKINEMASHVGWHGRSLDPCFVCH